MDDDKKHPQGQDDSFDEHELDLNTPEDLEAIEDVTFAEPSAESMNIFEEFDDLDDMDEFGQSPFDDTLNETEMIKVKDDIQRDEFGYRPDNNAMNLLEEDPFDFSTNKSTESSEKEEDIFASDAFEDVNADFPEGDSSSNLGDSQLFDYDPSTATTEEALQDQSLYNEVPQVGGGGSSGNGKGGGTKGLFNNRRVVRVVLLVILAGAVYAVLRVFTGSGAGTTELTNVTPMTTPQPVPTNVATPESAMPQGPAAVVATPEAQTPAEATPETAAAQTPAPVATAPQIAPTVVQAMPTAPAATTAAQVAPAPQAPVSAVNQPPETAFAVPAPGAMGVPATPAAVAPVSTGTAPGSDQITNKLNSLEASIQAIDSRLSTLSPSASRPSVSAGMKSPESQGQVDDHVLMEALEKLNGIDKKMSHLSDLQTQIQVLNKEVNALKGDVVQQSMIVGQNQAQINQNMAASIDQHAPKMFVQAAIPGRAWLRSETGQLITVIPGDEVGGYGRVVSIDATTGTVVMSSRAIFREQ